MTFSVLFFLKCFAVFLSMAVVDVFWTIWMTKVAEKKALASGIASTMIFLIGAFAVTEYVEDKTFLIPAALGGFVGSALPIWWKNAQARRAENRARSLE